MSTLSFASILVPLNLSPLTLFLDSLFRSLCTYSIVVVLVKPCLRVDMIKFIKLKIILFIRESSLLFLRLSIRLNLWRLLSSCSRDLVQLWKSQIYFVPAFGELCSKSSCVYWIWLLIQDTSELWLVVSSEVFTEFAHKYSLLRVKQWQSEEGQLSGLFDCRH